MSGETEADISGWTVDTLHHFVQRQVDDMRNLLDERDQANRRAVDAALAAATLALERAEANLSREFHEHLVQYRHEVALAFEASDRAISKAETAAEKRFEAVNEFRAQLNDQQRTFLTRIEYDGRHQALAEKVDAGVSRLADLELRVTSRLESGAGSQAATYRLIGWGFAGFGLFMSIVVFLANYIFAK